ncbi:hypothetical protein EPN15_00725 [Patescibacteria group bacterium]|nr:MAG: hypothetical protein EPN15_00725 [Patescibacteria group bacterium]
MEAVSFIIDIVLIVIGVLATFYAWQVGGSIGHGSMKLMAGGFLILGLANFIETLFFLIFTNISVENVEIIYRVIILAGFVLILVGYYRLAKFVRS